MLKLSVFKKTLGARKTLFKVSKMEGCRVRKEKKASLRPIPLIIQEDRKRKGTPHDEYGVDQQSFRKLIYEILDREKKAPDSY